MTTFTYRDLTLTMIPIGYRGHRLKYSYELSLAGKTIFSGDDFLSGTPDSESDMISLLGLLTLQRGDTDAEYFRNYTDEQLDFAESELADEIKMLCYDYEYSRSIEETDQDYPLVMESVEIIKGAINEI